MSSGCSSLWYLLPAADEKHHHKTDDKPSCDKTTDLVLLTRCSCASLFALTRVLSNCLCITSNKLSSLWCNRVIYCTNPTSLYEAVIFSEHVNVNKALLAQLMSLFRTG